MATSARVSRRTFLKVSATAAGGLLVGAFLESCASPTATPTLAPTAAATSAPTAPPGPPATPQPALTQTASPAPSPTALPAGSFQPNLFVGIGPDGTVTLTIHRSEMGQGVRTALAMILADELEADWSRVRVEQAPANAKFGSQTTGGSGSVADHYTLLRQAGAAARHLLIAAAAQVWGVPAQDLRAEQGSVLHPASGRRLDYGQLAGGAALVKARGLPALKDPGQFRLIGTSLPRVDDPAIVSGQAVFGLDVRLAGMLFATVARAPVRGASVLRFDEAAARAVSGVRAVVKVSSGVAVVAENTWAAIQGRAALGIQWKPPAGALLSSRSIRQQLIDLLQPAIAGEAAPGLTTLEAVYETPCLAHAPMEPVNCVADVRADQADIWASTQNPQDVQSFVGAAIGLPTHVHVTLCGGGFGRRLEVDFAIEAAEVSRAAGAPVKVMWTRDDDLQHDYYRQPTYHWLRAGWDQAGKLSLWRHYLAGVGLNGIAYVVGKEVLDEGLEAPYLVADRVSQSFLANIPIPTGPWRAVMAAPNAFANEAFFDEVAHALKKDPLQLRRDLLGTSDPLRPVVELAAAKAGWGTPPPQGHGRGLAAHTYHDTSVAMVAEASVAAGVVRVHKVVVALKCGRVIHPDMVAQQMEGGIAFGLTSLLKGEITFDQGRVQQSNFNDYPLLLMSEMPAVEVYALRDDGLPTGTGEMGVPPIVPAVVNAVFAVTGKRIRRLPVRAEDLR